jgi:hypothetical protein
MHCLFSFLLVMQNADGSITYWRNKNNTGAGGHNDLRPTSVPNRVFGTYERERESCVYYHFQSRPTRSPARAQMSSKKAEIRRNRKVFHLSKNASSRCLLVHLDLSVGHTMRKLTPLALREEKRDASKLLEKMLYVIPDRPLSCFASLVSRHRHCAWLFSSPSFRTFSSPSCPLCSSSSFPFCAAFSTRRL